MSYSAHMTPGVSFSSKRNHSVRDVEANRSSCECCRVEHKIAGATREVEDSIGGRELREVNQPSLPATILSVGKKSRNEIIAIGNRGKQVPDVPAFAFRRGNLGAK